MAAGPTTSFS
ncbi:hypothetical protein YPPY11_0267, partial [Yersinia pestis PY-11]